MGKEQFKEADTSRKVIGVKFTAGNTELIRQAAHIQIFNNRLYEDVQGKWLPAQYGPLDARLKNMSECVGHFGFIDLEYPVFHVGFFRLIIQTLQCICKGCSQTLLQDGQKSILLRQASNPNLDYLRKKALQKKIVAMSKKLSLCTKCGFVNGVVKKAVGAILKISHHEPLPSETLAAVEDRNELQQLLSSSKLNLLDPLKVMEIFKRIDLKDLPLLMIGADECKHPMHFLNQRIPVPPVCIRPSVVSELKSGSNEDDITMKLTEIMLINDILKKHKQDGAPMKTICETWDHLQVQCALYINSEMSGLPPELQPKKFLRSFAQRLKGKHGRFRGNLSGKRVDFTARTVISPDPNLKIDQVGVPLQVAMILTFPEVVCRSNIERMRQVVKNGDSMHPGANHIVDCKTGNKRFLRYGNRAEIARNLQLGDTVERHLADGDVVLFNRQPSLHKISIMSHRVKVMPYRTFRFNECACTPYNADFDGDEMNLHLPQTYEAKAESSLLMGVKHNLVSPRAGQPLIAAIQDFITAGHLLTKKDTFLTHSEVQRIAATLLDITEVHQRKIRLPPPVIIWPIKLWTGKQLIELIIAPFVDSNVRLNLATKNKIHNPDDGEFTHKDTFVLIRNNQLLCGSLDKTLLGSESKTSIFYTLLRDWSEQHAIDAMWRLARFSAVFLSNRGFSIGIGDVRPNKQLLSEKRILLETGYKICEQLNKTMKMEKLKTKPDLGLVEELEAKILKELSNIRDQAGKACREFLSKNNTPLTMAQCGSKGSFINIAQMIALVGQQSISGKRPSDGFDNRSLPHFEQNDRSPDAKGFVENSFYSGLTPTEFFFHTMGGREGLVDTAVKTAETGYMQRRLVKCLEDLVISYDNTVRTSTNEVVQFVFGDDGLDPCYMEARDGKLLDLSHLLNQVRSTQKEIFQTNSPSSDSSVYELDNLNIIRQEINSSLSAIQNKLIKDNKKLLITNKFADEIFDFICKHFNANKRLLQLPVNCERHRAYMSPTTRSGKVCCKTCEEYSFRRQALLRSSGLSLAQIRKFLTHCQRKVRRAIVEPGTAVGAIAATSIGEPSTQMTLKTFHFAGVASMNITQGVPRIKEIINAVRSISTPIITVALANDKDEKLAKRVKARIERTTLGEVSEYVEQIFLPDDMFVLVKLNTRRIREIQLEVTPDSIIQSICSARLPIPSIKSSQVRTVGKSILLVRPIDTGKCSMAMYMHYLKYFLPTVPIKGIHGVTRCVINADDKKGDSFQLFVEGSSFKEVLALNEINGIKTRFNNAIVIAEVLGIEAARGSIISEILNTMNEHGIELDRRHVMLLADLMTYRGEVLGITRNGLVKMKESVLLLASFERTIDHLYEAAFFGQKDKIIGVSECIIMGVPIGIGTGMFKLLQKQSSQIQKKITENEKQDNKGNIKLLPSKHEIPSSTQNLEIPVSSIGARRRRQASTSTAPLKEAKIEIESGEEQSIEVLPPKPPILMHRQPIFEMPELDLII